MILLYQIKGVSQKMIDRWIVECAIALPGHPPETVNHSTAENLYERSKCSALWKKEVEKSLSISPYVYITETVQHIVDKTARLYKNAAFKNKW